MASCLPRLGRREAAFPRGRVPCVDCRRRRLQRFQVKKAMATVMRIEKPTPAPIPAIAPVDSPSADRLRSLFWLVSELSLGLSLWMVVASAVVEVDGIVVLVEAEYMVPTTLYFFSLLLYRAQISGSDGRTMKRPTPVSQQSVV